MDVLDCQVNLQELRVACGAPVGGRFGLWWPPFEFAGNGRGDPNHFRCRVAPFGDSFFTISVDDSICLRLWQNDRQWRRLGIFIVCYASSSIPRTYFREKFLPSQRTM